MNFDDKLDQAARQLATEIAPERDLWPGIEQAIAAPPRRERSMWNTLWAQAAAIVLLVGLLFALPNIFAQDPVIEVTGTRGETVGETLQQNVLAALERLMEGRTALVISHDLPKLRNMDSIVVLRNGRFIEQVTHDVLLAGNGI